MAGINYIPGTKIPSMTTGAGKAARTAGLTRAQNRLNSKLTGGIVELIGADAVKANTTQTFLKLAYVIQQGCNNAVAYLNYDMYKTPPVIPKDTGALRESWFSLPVKEVSGSNFKIGVKAGFGGTKKKGKYVDYAIYVHEMTDEAYGKKINWTEPGSGPKFLEKGLNRNSEKMMAIVIKTIKAAL